MIDQLLLTEVELPEGHPRAGHTCPVYGYVIHHEAGPVLVDTGVGAGHPDVDRLYSPRHRPLDAALAAVGVASDGVIMVINSHLHFDHCGGNRAFAGVPIVVQRAEREAARGERYTVPEWVDFPAARWRLVDGETEVLPGITVLPTPGHTAGHQSVIVGDGVLREVIAAQAVWDGAELDAERSTEPLPEAEADATAASARSIKELRPARVWFSHDGTAWHRSDP